MVGSQFLGDMQMSAFLHWYVTNMIFFLFSISRYALFFSLFFLQLSQDSIKFFFVQDMSQNPPSQELVAKDLHGNEWHFRHIFRGYMYSAFLVDRLIWFNLIVVSSMVSNLDRTDVTHSYLLV